jgi:hypothetical protein
VRRPVDAARLERFLQRFGAAGGTDGTCYLAGGATAVLLGWRQSTIDIDLKLDPEQDDRLRALPGLKADLEINVELASPGDFIPLPPEWQDRSISIGRFSSLTVLHLDLYAQALAKLERGHARDLEDVSAMIERGFVERPKLLELFEAIEPELYRFPAVDPPTFRVAVEHATGVRS